MRYKKKLKNNKNEEMIINGTYNVFNEKIQFQNRRNRDKIDSHKTPIHAHSLSCLGTVTSIKKSGGV